MLKASFASGLLGEFGYEQGLPWGAPIKGDMEQFIKFTDGCVLFMGHNTFASLPSKLRNLTHLVLTNDPTVTTKDGQTADCWVSPDLDKNILLAALKAPEVDVCIIGGPALIEGFASQIDQLLHTTVITGAIYSEASCCQADTFIDLHAVLSHFKNSSELVANGNERGFGFYTRIYNK